MGIEIAILVGPDMRFDCKNWGKFATLVTLSHKMKLEPLFYIYIYIFVNFVGPVCV